MKVDNLKTGPAVSTAQEGLIRAQERMAQAAERVAKGDISAEALVATKLGELDVRVQLKNLKKMNELEDQILDILA